MTANGGEHSAANRVRMGRPGLAGQGRDHFGLTGTSHAFDPRIVRPDAASPPGEARAPKHVLMMQGIVDHYILPPIANSISLSLGLDQAGEALDAKIRTLCR